jgi:hypothetical protein
MVVFRNVIKATRPHAAGYDRDYLHVTALNPENLNPKNLPSPLSLRHANAEFKLALAS